MLCIVRILSTMGAKSVHCGREEEDIVDVDKGPTSVVDEQAVIKHRTCKTAFLR